MKIGDKVRFLNTTGGGIVKSFQGKDIAIVEDSDGFDIPMLIRECVVIEPSKEAQARQTSQQQVEVTKAAANKTAEPEYKVQETKEGEHITVYMAYLPINIKSLSDTDYECYLVNDSNYYLMFNYMSRATEGWVSRNTGTIEPNTKLFVEEFSKSELNDLEKICLQFIAYKQDKPFSIKNSYSIELRIDTVKFYKLHSFKHNEYFDEDALLYPIVRKDVAEKELIIEAEEIEKAIQEKQAARPRTQPIVKKNNNELVEIDLHIDELLDNTNGLTSGDMLEYQINKFREVMDENQKRKGQKIVFIHGKGDGILKNAILKELKTNYKTAYYQDASFREYGYGATMVTIK